MKRHPRFLRTIAFATACAVAFATGAAAQVVEVPPAPIAEEDYGTDLSAATLLAALPPTARDPAAEGLQDAPEAPVGSVFRLDPSRGLVPVTLSAGTGGETRLSVNVTAANEASEGWPWWGKACVVVGCVVVAGLATWAIVEACDGGSHTSGDNSSQTLTVTQSGEGNAIHINYHSPPTTSTSTSTTTTTGGPAE